MKEFELYLFEYDEVQDRMILDKSPYLTVQAQSNKDAFYKADFSKLSERDKLRWGKFLEKGAR